MELINIGQKAALLFIKDNKLVEMTCSIENIHDDRLDLSLPQYFMRYVECLQVGANLTVKIFSKIGTIDFNTVVISSPLDDEEFFSVEFDLNAVKLTPNEEIPSVNAVESMEVYKENEIIKLKTFELSTEFTRFYSDKKFAIDDVIDAAIILPKNYGIIRFKGTITEIDPVYDNEYTVRYDTMTETTRQTLLYYMYLYSSDID